MSIELVRPSNHLIFSHPLLLPSILPSIKVFSNEKIVIRGPEYWSFSFSISPSKEYSGLISFKMDWFDLLQSKGFSRVFYSSHSLKASILQCSVFLVFQLSHPHMITGKTIALTI